MDQVQQVQKKRVTILMCLGYALQKGEDGKVIMARELEQRLDFLVEDYLKQQTELQQQQGERQIIIVTSGRGKVDIESQQMKDYLIKNHGVNSENIFAEKYSMNTVENFLFTFYYLWQQFDRKTTENPQVKVEIELKVVTSDFHVKRVQYIADSATKLILPIFEQTEFLPIQYLGAKTVSEKTEEAPILWEKAKEKIERILYFNFDLNKFMEEREFDNKDKEQFLEYKNLIQK